MDGAADRASVKQIIHMSSASCLSDGFSSEAEAHPCKHGKHFVSPLMPPHK